MTRICDCCGRKVSSVDVIICGGVAKCCLCTCTQHNHSSKGDCAHV